MRRGLSKKHVLLLAVFAFLIPLSDEKERNVSKERECYNRVSKCEGIVRRDDG